MSNFKHTVTIGTFGVITNEKDQVLLVHRNDYYFWNLPGGGLEKGETPWDGAIREVKEETGLDVEIVKLLGVYSKPTKDEIVFNFECKVIGGALTLNEEARDLQYFDLDKIPQNTSPKQVERIHDYFQNKNTVTLKEQEGVSTIDLVKAGKL